MYNIMRKSQAHAIDHEVQPKDWHHPADSVRIKEKHDEQAFKYSLTAAKASMALEPA